MPGCWMSMARQDGLTSVLEPSRQSEASPVFLRGPKDVLEVDQVKETSMEETDEERIGGIAKPVVAPLVDDEGPFCLFRPLGTFRILKYRLRRIQKGHLSIFSRGKYRGGVGYNQQSRSG